MPYGRSIWSCADGVYRRPRIVPRSKCNATYHTSDETSKLGAHCSTQSDKKSNAHLENLHQSNAHVRCPTRSIFQTIMSQPSHASILATQQIKPEPTENDSAQGKKHPARPRAPRKKQTKQPIAAKEEKPPEQPIPPKDCTECNNTGEAPCPPCNGSGLSGQPVPCFLCHWKPDQEARYCPGCHGSRQTPVSGLCGHCNGSGEMWCACKCKAEKWMAE